MNIRFWNKLLAVLVGINILVHTLIPHHHHGSIEEAQKHHFESCDLSKESESHHFHMVHSLGESDWNPINIEFKLVAFHFENVEFPSWIEYLEISIIESNFYTNHSVPISPFLLSRTLRGPPQFS